MSKLLNQDCLDYLRKTGNVNCIFADPPDNLGLDYDGYKDKRIDYYDWLELILFYALKKADVFWLSYYYKHDLEIKHRLRCILQTQPRNVRTFIWRYRFGQYRDTDNPNGYRPILRISKLYWNPIMKERIKSVRQQIGDKRASGDRVPDDVWDYSRIQGNNKERCPWHPTQHPEALYRRIALQSVPDGGTFIDLFAGTGTCFRACNCDVIGIEQSKKYCELIRKNNPLLT